MGVIRSLVFVRSFVVFGFLRRFDRGFSVGEGALFIFSCSVC